jgi:hypothetical protein
MITKEKCAQGCVGYLPDMTGFCVVANLPGRDTSQDGEGVNMAFEERLLVGGRRHAVNGFAGVGHPQREQVHRDQLTAEPDRDLTEVDLGFSAR